MGYKVHTVDGKSGEVSLAHVRSQTAQITINTPAAGTHVMCRIPAAATVTAIRGYLVGGTSVTFNVTRRRSTTNVDLLAADLVANTADAWTSSTTIQNGALAAGDTLIADIAAQAGNPTQAVIEVDYTVAPPA